MPVAPVALAVEEGMAEMVGMAAGEETAETAAMVQMAQML